MLFSALILICLTISLSSESYSFPLNKNPSKKAYRKVLKNWTRQREEFQRDDLYSSLRWYATLQSPEFIQAKSNYMNDIYLYRGEERQKLADQESQKFSAVTGFFISLYSYDYKYSDLTRKDSYWKLYLEVNGKRYEPVSIERIDKLTPLYQVLYPYSDLWSRYFYVYFPKIDMENVELKLFVAGPTSRSELKWSL